MIAIAVDSVSQMTKIILRIVAIKTHIRLPPRGARAHAQRAAPLPPSPAFKCVIHADREFWHVIRRSLSTVSRLYLEMPWVQDCSFRRRLKCVMARKFPVVLRSCTGCDTPPPVP